MAQSVEILKLQHLQVADVACQFCLSVRHNPFRPVTPESTTPKIKNWGDYWSLGVSLPFVVTKESKLTVGWAYTEGRDNFLKQGPSPKAANPAAVGRGVFTVSYAWTF